VAGACTSWTSAAQRARGEREAALERAKTLCSNSRVVQGRQNPKTKKQTKKPQTTSPPNQKTPQQPQTTKKTPRRGSSSNFGKKDREKKQKRGDQRDRGRRWDTGICRPRRGIDRSASRWVWRAPPTLGDSRKSRARGNRIAAKTIDREVAAKNKLGKGEDSESQKDLGKYRLEHAGEDTRIWKYARPAGTLETRAD